MKISRVNERLRRNGVLFALWDRFNAIGVDTLYGKSYYKRMEDALQDPMVRIDLENFADVVLDTLHPDSVIDFGCGIGHWLQPFYARGVRIYGVDGSEYAVSQSCVPQEFVKAHDLRDPYVTDDQYDVAMCIEVLEHLPEDAATTAVSTLTNAAPVCVVSAAPPGQGGTYHVNEQATEYWIDQFESAGHSYRPDLTEELRSRLEFHAIEFRAENLSVFAERA